MLSTRDRLLHCATRWPSVLAQVLAMSLVLAAPRSLAQPEFEAALQAAREAARAAAEQKDYGAVASHGERINELLYAEPAWAVRAEKSASAIDASKQDSLQQWEAIRSQMAQAFEAGDGSQARELADKALDLAETSFGPNHLNTVLSLREAADAAFATSDIVAAESLLSLAIERVAAAVGDKHPRTLELLRLLADLQEQSGAIEGAVATHDELAQRIGGAGEVMPAASALALDIGLARSQVLDRAGRADESVDLLQQVCGGMEDSYGKIHARPGECYAILGATLLRGGSLTDASRAFEQALAIQTLVFPASHVEVLRTRAEAAEVDRVAGRAAEALSELNAISKLAGNVSGEGGEIVALDIESYRGRALEDNGDYAQAMRVHSDVYQKRLSLEGDLAPATLAALNFVAGAQMRLGLLNEAEVSYRAALEGYRLSLGEKHPAAIAVLNNLGVLLEQQGLYDEAEPVLREGLNLAEEVLAPAHPTTLRNMNNLGLLYESQGNFDRAEALYSASRQVLGTELGEHHPDTTAVSNNLAFLYMLQQDYPRAVEMFTAAIANFEAALGAKHQNTLKAKNNLGRVYLRMNEIAQAEGVIETTLAARSETLGENHIDTLRSMLDLGAVYLAAKRFDDAERQLRATLERDERVLGPLHPYTFETLNALAKALEGQQQGAQALKLRAEGFARRTRFLDRMLWVASENGREGYIRLHRPELDAYLSSLNSLDAAAGGAEVLRVALQRKGLLLRVSSEIAQIAKLGLDPQMSQIANALVSARKDLASRTLAGPQGESEDVHLRRVRDLERRVEELEGELGRLSVSYRERVSDYDTDDLAKALPENASLVDFLIYEDATGKEQMVAGILRKQGGSVSTQRVSYDYGAIAMAIRDYREVIQDEGADDAEVVETGQSLYDLLWAPLQPHLSGAVYLVPDGQLNVLPFDALPNADGEYLLNLVDLHILSTSRDLLPRQVPAKTNGQVVLLAGPDYDTEEVAGTEVLAAARSRRAELTRSAGSANSLNEGNVEAGTTRGRLQNDVMRSLSLAEVDSRSAAFKASLRAASTGMRGLRFSPLPGAEQEGRLIDAEVGKSGIPRSLFTRINAEEQVLANLNAAPRVLHIATHGFFLQPSDELRKRLLAMQRGSEVQVPPPGDNPLLRAGLAFAGINSNAPFLGEIDTNNDGVLTALEVLGLDLEGTELAVLSACETGLGEIHYGEGVYGLRRAFKEAGVNEIVMSLWEVSDAGTQALMTEMYARLVAGKSPREALRGAQQALIADPQWNYPYVWAAFTVVGR